MQQGLPRVHGSWVIMVRVALCDINEAEALVEPNENALTFGSRARGRHRCDMVLSLSTALALDAQSRR